jgi:hypothetical protein
MDNQQVAPLPFGEYLPPGIDKFTRHEWWYARKMLRVCLHSMPDGSISNAVGFQLIGDGCCMDVARSAQALAAESGFG